MWGILRQVRRATKQDAIMTPAQIRGIRERCGSLASNGLPDFDNVESTTQLLLPPVFEPKVTAEVTAV